MFICVLLYLERSFSSYRETELGHSYQARRRGGFEGFERTPFGGQSDGGLKTQTVDFQLLANSGGMENKL